MKRCILALGLIFAAQSLLAQDWAKARLNNSPRHGEWVEIKSGDRTIKAFVVYPERKDKAPVVLVISEIFGLTDWVRSLCDELAENGVIAIAPDLRKIMRFICDPVATKTSKTYETTKDTKRTKTRSQSNCFCFVVCLPTCSS